MFYFNTYYSILVQNLLEAHCYLTGNVIRIYEGVKTEQVCSDQMKSDDGGRYFLFNKEDEQCMIYDSTVRNCGAYHGPQGVSTC